LNPLGGCAEYNSDGPNEAIQRRRPNETEISHGRVSWQNTLNSFRNGAVGSSFGKA